MRQRDELFAALSRSKFRRRFSLGATERRYIAGNGLDRVLEHAREFVTLRLAPKLPPNDGRQTPLRGHPAFIAQHATGTCCRKCLAKWHHIAEHAHLNIQHIDYVVDVIRHWLLLQLERNTDSPGDEHYGSSRGPSERQQELF
jgi:hypothetical protein